MECANRAPWVWSRQQLMPYYFPQTPALSRIDLELRLSTWKFHWSAGSTLINSRCQPGRNPTWLGSCSLWEAVRGLSRVSLASFTYSQGVQGRCSASLLILSLKYTWGLVGIYSCRNRAREKARITKKGHDISWNTLPARSWYNPTPMVR
jgi:hypothetical protein